MASTQNQNFLSQYAASVNALLDARAALKALRERDTATGIVASLTADDFAGANSFLNRDAITSAFAAMDQLEGLLTDYTKQPPAPTVLLKFRP